MSLKKELLEECKKGMIQGIVFYFTFMALVGTVALIYNAFQ